VNYPAPRGGVIHYKMKVDNSKKTCKADLAVTNQEPKAGDLPGFIDIRYDAVCKYSEKNECCCRCSIYLHISYTNLAAGPGTGVGGSVKIGPLSASIRVGTEPEHPAGGTVGKSWKYVVPRSK